VSQGLSAVTKEKKHKKRSFTITSDFDPMFIKWVAENRDAIPPLYAALLSLH
jgi:hypothetical protein